MAIRKKWQKKNGRNSHNTRKRQQKKRQQNEIWPKVPKKRQKNDHFWAHCALEINKTEI